MLTIYYTFLFWTKFNITKAKKTEHLLKMELQKYLEKIFS